MLGTGAGSRSPGTSEKMPNPGELLLGFLDGTTALFHVLDEHGTICWANDGDLKILGYAHDDYVGHQISEFHVDKVL